ncbi:MAG: hypothetical protein PVTTEEND_001132 [Candidatus Fervidibacter sp.]|jgi:Acyl-CoA reductase (LuxC).
MQTTTVEALKRLEQVRSELQSLSVADIATALERVARYWLNEAAPERQQVLAELPQRLPFSRPVCERALNTLFEPMTAERLLRLLDEQLGDHRALDAFVLRPNGVRRKAFGANVALLILAGNIIGVGIWDIAFCLLCKTPVLVKPSSDEPLLPALFAKSLAAIAPELAEAIAILPATEVDISALLTDAVEAVIVYGTDETVTAIKRQVPAKVRVIERGHRISVVIVAEEFADERTAELLALDIARFDQRGCLSPQICFIVGRGAGDAGREFGETVVKALERMSAELPTNLREGEKASVAQFRLTCEMLGATVLASSDASWTVAIWDGERGAEDGWRKVACSARVVHLVAMPSLSAVLDALRPMGRFLQGVALATDEATAEQLAEALGQIGASRICPVGQLQVPPMEWSQDGKHLVAELVRWCDFETIALPPKESGWVEVFYGEEAKALLLRAALEERGIPVSLQSDVDPANPTVPLQRLFVPASYADDARQVLANLSDH